MRIKDTYENQLSVLETDKLSLIQRLNDALVALDRLNQEKGVLSAKLMELLKFVREVTRETQKGDDLNGVVSDELKSEYKNGKELTFALKEGLKRAEIERLRVLNKLAELEQLRCGLTIESTDMKVNLESKSLTYE